MQNPFYVQKCIYTICENCPYTDNNNCDTCVVMDIQSDVNSALEDKYHLPAQEALCRLSRGEKI